MKMIHFDFVVDAIDAENIFEAINHRIYSTMEFKTSLMCGEKDEVYGKNVPELILWSDKNVEYWQELKKKMLNYYYQFPEEKEN